MANLAAAFDAFAACDVDSLTRTELVAVLDDYETLACRLPTPRHRLLTRLQAQTTPAQMGAKSWNEVLRIRWRLSTAEASRRLHEAADLAARTSLTGQPLAPRLPAVAAAQAAGAITGEHVAVIRDALKTLPSWVDTTTCGQLEVDLVRVATGVGPKELKRDRRTAAVPARSGRPRTRRHRTRPQTPSRYRSARPRRDDTPGRRVNPPRVGGVGSAVRQIRRPGHVQPRRRATLHHRHPQPGPDRQRRPQPGPTPTRRHARHRAHRVDER